MNINILYKALNYWNENNRMINQFYCMVKYRKLKYSKLRDKWILKYSIAYFNIFWC